MSLEQTNGPPSASPVCLLCCHCKGYNNTFTLSSPSEGFFTKGSWAVFLSSSCRLNFILLEELLCISASSLWLVAKTFKLLVFLSNNDRGIWNVAPAEFVSLNGHVFFLFCLTTSLCISAQMSSVAIPVFKYRGNPWHTHIHTPGRSNPRASAPGCPIYVPTHLCPLRS